MDTLWRPRRINCMKPVLLACLAAAIALPAIAQEASIPRPTPEPKVQQTVVEDDAVRIEELRVRGQTQRIVVRPKKGPAGPYEVLPVDGSRDTSQRSQSGSYRGAGGQSVWHVMTF